jgi:hypothetical protein
LTFPVIGLEVEAPESDDVLIVFMVFATEEVHHVIEDDGGVSLDVAEGVVVEEMGGDFGPYFGGDVVAVDGALFGEVVLGLLSEDASVDIEGGFVDDC